MQRVCIRSALRVTPNRLHPSATSRREQGHRRRPGYPTNSMARSTHLNGVSAPNASMDVQEKNAGAATSSSRSRRHSRFLKSLSSPFPFLALLKSRSDGLLRHSPLPLPRPTRKQTTRCNSQTGKRTGSRKKNTETARGQRPEWGGPRAKMARGSARSRRSFLGTLSQYEIKDISSTRSQTWAALSSRSSARNRSQHTTNSGTHLQLPPGG